MAIKFISVLVCATGMAMGQATPATTSAQDDHSPRQGQSSENLNVQSDPPMLGIRWARGFEPNARAAEDAKTARPRKDPDMTYHGGKIMTTANTKAIFWGTSWENYSGDKITGMDSCYTGFDNSSYAKTSDEYTGSNGQVGPTTTHGGHIIDASASTGGSNPSTILAEVCKEIASPDPTGNGYYAVYTDTPRGHAGYCAWHSYGSCNGVPVQFAFFFNL